MNHCCIPFCKSARGKKEKTGFFEFPYKIKQRLLWQNAIIQACEDIGISEDFCKFAERSIVCEKHFTEKDFSISTTRKRILPNAIPSIFQNVSTAKQKNFLNTNKPSNTVLSSPFKYCTVNNEFKSTISSIFLKDVEETSLKQVTTLDDESLKQNSKYHIEEMKEKAHCIQKPIIIKLDTRDTLAFKQNNSFECNNSNENLELYAEESKKEPGCKDKALAKQLHNKLKILKRQNANLHCRMKQSMKKYSSLSSNEKELSLEEEQFKNIINEKARNELPASLLFEQIQNYGKKKLILSSTTLKFYFLWQQQFPGGYNYVRKNKYFSLPHRNTLAKYVEFSPKEEDQSSMEICDEAEAIESGII